METKFAVSQPKLKVPPVHAGLSSDKRDRKREAHVLTFLQANSNVKNMRSYNREKDRFMVAIFGITFL